ncbi:hypothetical protein DCMF_00430 [Candidatus Formimonas warabiya]|uniref:SAF domain-containing protein n=2 Tax=Formimonas warabiya TaxID=1761012 RepID=A0A3G1L0G6_FORW1|nr:hypothetical protein DCMF_00430 [Candidatus Formimonas warabiya]
MKRLVSLSAEDNAATALSDISPGDECCLEVAGNKYKFNAEEGIPFGHKVALIDFQPGDQVIKYGEIIGRATKTIKKGSHLHIHNVVSDRVVK